ncbi:MAG: D-alanyl-D-alanine carboxypeptidase [Lachnospiraceae bacterium]|nr:D-alanyl-D-alanine carboxypeptidase [Lachnospiraceae bacterium]
MKKSMRNKKVVLISIVMVIAILTQQPMYVQADETNLKLYAKAAVLMDADSGRVLYDRCGNEQLAMASTTKIMTLIVTLENASLDDTVEVSAYAASMPQVHLGMRSGEQYRLRDLVLSLMLESHNDSAVAIAEHVGGSVEQFAALMNQKAAEIGCENTYYITPNGLDAVQGEKFHSTTARDLALVMSYCVAKSPQKETFLEITRTPNHSFTDLSGTRSFSCVNHNAFLGMMTGALSGKTGFTNKAGYCYVGALRRDGKTFVVALLACGWPNHRTYKWSDTRTLMEYGLAHYNYRSFDEVELPAEARTDIIVSNGQSGRIGERMYVPVEIAADVTGVEGLLMHEDEKVTITLHKVKELTAPVREGQTIGYITYAVGSQEWKRMRLVAAGGIKAVDLKWCIQKVVEKWMISENKSSGDIVVKKDGKK